MDEEQLNPSWQPFGTEDAQRLEAQSLRASALGAALWGNSDDRLQRQLLAPHPEIPPDYTLDDLRALQRFLQQLAILARNPKSREFRGLSSMLALRTLFEPTVSIGSTLLTPWEARCEIIRRAIQYLEGR